MKKKVVDKALQRKVLRDRIFFEDFKDELIFEFCPVGNLDSIIKDLRTLHKRLKCKFRQYQWFELDYRDEYEGDTQLVFVGCRWETDEEYNKRVERLQQLRARRHVKLVKEKPHVCPHCKSRYKEARFIQGNECPACLSGVKEII